VLPRVTIGPITEMDVDVLVAKPGALHENLLGMSFLNRLSSFTFSNDRLVLRGQ
jgi:aspartyl protease family protein